MAEVSSEFGQGFAAAVAAAERSVVRVDPQGRHAATGTAWSDDLVITSLAALGDADEVKVGLEGGAEHAAALVGRDAGLDLALLRVSGAKLAKLALPPDKPLRVGQWAIALGRPGQAIRASLRIIGVLGPEQRTAFGGRLERYIESDRGLPRGFAGGPLVDAAGEAIGMNTGALFRGADLAIPGETLARVIEELSAHGKVRRGYLGVSVHPVRLPDPIAAQAKRERGLLVLQVEPGSPAEKAGLLQGDAIVELAGRPLAHARELAAVLSDAVGRELPAQIVRGGALQTLAVAAGERQ